jgi:two-component system chemotaxis response regulator CheV
MECPPPAAPVGARETYTILHADDSGSVRRLVHNLLQDGNRFNLIQCGDGDEAWNTLLSLKAKAGVKGAPITDLLQAVISDIEMPRLDGLTLCRQIKEDSMLKVLPVALFSSLISDRLEHKGVSVGAYAQFAKPDLQRLSDKLLDLLSKKNL